MTEFEAVFGCLELPSLSCFFLLQPTLSIHPRPSNSLQRSLTRPAQHLLGALATNRSPASVARPIASRVLPRLRPPRRLSCSWASFSCREHHRLSALLLLLLAASTNPCAPTTISPTSNHRRQTGYNNPSLSLASTAAGNRYSINSLTARMQVPRLYPLDLL